jgi:hypothetical protein
MVTSGKKLCMRYRNEMVAVIAAMLAATLSAPAQVPSPNPASKAFTDAANALGMVRGVARSLQLVNMFEYTANGTMTAADGGQSKVKRITAGYDYVIPAARIDIETIASDGSTRRSIEVASGQLSWDERTPGIYLQPGGTSAAARLSPIWLLPHGLILAGAKVIDQVKVADRNGQQEFAVPLPDGTVAKGLVGAKNLMTRVEYRIGEKLASADYADYKDFQDYGVMFPTRIVQKLDGRTVADLTVTDALANPYLVFPVPKEMLK